MIGGFVIGLSACYALWKYPEYLLLETVPRIESPAATVEPLVRIQSRTVGEQVASPITVGAISLSRRTVSFDGLLGMNFLQKFEFSLGQQRSLLELHFRRDGGAFSDRYSQSSSS